MIVYKVLQRTETGSLISVIAWGKGRKYYRQGVTHHAPKWLADEGYYLMAFTKLSSAKSFKPWYQNIEIWLCEATDILPELPLKMPYAINFARGRIIRNYPPNYLSLYHNWPIDTVMCKGIKLLKLLKKVK